MNRSNQPDESKDQAPGSRSARLLRLIAIIFHAYAVTAIVVAWRMASGRALEAIEPLKYQAHLDIRVCLNIALLAFSAAGATALLSFLVRPSWGALVLFGVAPIAWIMLFVRYLGLIA